MEVIAGLVLISAVAMAAALAAAQILALRQAVYRRTLVRETTANMLDTIDSWSFEEVPQRVKELMLPPQVATQLPNAQLSIEINDAASPIPLREIATEITWGRGPHRLRTVTWKFAVDADSATGGVEEDAP